MAPRWSSDDYDVAVRQVADAVERERLAVAAGADSDTADEAIVAARTQLRRIGQERLLAPIAPAAVQGEARRLQADLRSCDDRLAALAVAIEQEVDRVIGGNAARSRREAQMQDLLWRVPIPVLAGFVALAALSAAMPALLAVVVAAVFGAVGLALLQADVVDALRARPDRPGLADQDVGLLCAGALAALYGLVAAAGAHNAGDQLGALAAAAIGTVIAWRRLSTWRAARG